VFVKHPSGRLLEEARSRKARFSEPVLISLKGLASLHALSYSGRFRPRPIV